MPINLPNALNDAWEAVSTAAEAAAEGAQDAAEAAQQASQKAGEWLDGAIDDAGQAGENALNTTIDAVATYVEPTTDRALGLIESTRDKVFGAVGKAADWLTDKAGSLSQLVVGAAQRIIERPLDFVADLTRSVAKGLDQFVGNMKSHLLGGALAWLGETFERAGIALPETFTMKSVAQTGLQVLGLTADRLREKSNGVFGA